MGINGKIIKECERANMDRRVYEGRVDHGMFFQNVCGNLLISGENAGNHLMLEDMACSYADRNDMPAILLTGHRELLDRLAKRKEKGGMNRLLISSPEMRNYHPLYGVSAQQMIRLIMAAGEEMGCKAIQDRMISYAAAAIDIVSMKYPVSLPAVSALLKKDDDAIASCARGMGMSNIIADNILGSHEAGIVLRRIVERMEDAFENVAVSQTDTKYNFQSGSRQDLSVMAFYQVSSNQKLMNACLKEELYAVLRKAPRIRVILDEVSFQGETDELLIYLMQMKRQGKIELAVISGNAKEMLPGVKFDFENICLFPHSTPGATEELSRDLFGSYQYHYPACTSGRPPAVLFTLQKDIHYHMASEERLKIRAEDLYGMRKLFGAASDYAAIKTTSNNNIYLVPINEFLPIE